MRRLRELSLLVVAGTNVIGVLLAGVSGGLVLCCGGGGCRVWSLAVQSVVPVV